MLLLESTTFSATSEHTHFDLDNLDIDFHPSSSTLDLKSDSTRTTLRLPEPIPELNDFNIAQVQMEYESTVDMDNSLNTIHSLTSIDLLNDHNDIDDPDYDARRMSSSAISSASAHSAHSVHTSSTAATSHSGFSQGIKRAQSPGMMDDFDSYDAFQDSPRVKRPRPSLSLEPGSIRMESASPAPTNTTASAGGNSADTNSNGSGNGSSRVQLPPLFSALENTSSSAPPTSHGSQTPFAMHNDNNNQMQQSHQQHQQGFSQSQGPSQGQTSPFPTGSFAFNVTGTGLDLRRGSLPSLYSNSLAARYAQRMPSQGNLLGQTQGGSRYGFNTNASSGGMGMSPGPSPLSSLSAPPVAGSANDASSGLAGYQFPAPSGSDSSHGSNGSGSTPTATPNTSTSAPGASPFGSGMTPTSTLSSAPSNGFPQTPLDFSQHGVGSSSSSNYHQAYGQQNQNQKEYDRLTKEYLNTGNDWGSIARPASTPSSAVNTPASANPSGGFGFTTSSGGLGGLPRISGHSKNTDPQQQQQEWFTSAGQLVLPSPSTNTGSSPSSSHSQSQRQQHQPQQASLSPSPRMHSSSSGGGSSASASAAAAAAAAAAALNVSPAAAVQAAQVAAQVAARPARRRGKLPKPTTDFLKDWLHRHSDHPYPSEEEKKQLCHATGLSMSQVSNWMINARRRILAPAQRNQQGPTTTVPSFSLGGSNANVSRTPLGLSPTGHLSSSHQHHQHQHMSHSQSGGYGGGMGMSTSMSGIGLGLIGTNGHGLGGMNGMGGGGGSHSMGYPHQQQQQHHQHSLHTTAQGLGMTGSGMYAPHQYRSHQQQQQQLGHGGMYDIGHLHAQRRASMPALALHSSLSHSHSSLSHSPLSNTGGGNGSLQLYPSSTSTAARNSLPGPSPLPQVGYTSTYSPQPGSSSMSGSGSQQQMIGLGTAGTPPAPTPQRGYVFPPPQAGGSSGGSDEGR